MTKVAVIALLLICSGCSTNGAFEQKIVRRINSTCKGSIDCTIRIKDLTNFDWDKMYAFKYTVRADEAEKAMGVPLPEYTEFTRKIVFLKSNQIVYFEEEPTDIEGPVNGQIAFDIPDLGNYKLYTPDTAVFKARKLESRNIVYYELNQIQ